MLVLSKIEEKRGLSNLVAYVLLISITISLSVLVYGWLKSYVGDDDVPECPSNVNVVIEGYECVSGTDGTLTVYLKNKGFFDVDGFVIRVHDRKDAEFGFYVFDEGGVPLSPGESWSWTYNFADYSDIDDEVTLVDVQPFLIDGEKVACESYASQRVSCS